MDDPYNLERFIEAQDRVFARVWSEINARRKLTLWMWFIFPQLGATADTDMSRRYGLHSLDEARAYLDHPILGMRLRECTELLLSKRNSDAYEVFGSDDLKFHASMTLFARVCGEHSPFQDALAKFFHNEDHTATIRLLQGTPPAGPPGGIASHPP